MGNLTKSDERIERVFFELLPHYWKTPDELPAQIRLILALNRWGSVFHACQDIALHLTQGKQSRRLQKELTHMQVWKGVEPL